MTDKASLSNAAKRMEARAPEAEIRHAASINYIPVGNITLCPVCRKGRLHLLAPLLPELRGPPVTGTPAP